MYATEAECEVCSHSENMELFAHRSKAQATHNLNGCMLNQLLNKQ